MKKIISVALIASFLFALTACGGAQENTESATNENIGEAVDYTIYGIDPGAGITAMTHNALDVYGLSNWTLNESSDAAMMAELARKYKNNEPIIITGWTPHWMFQAYDLKYLDDPEKVYGDEEAIHSMARLGLKDDEPTAYAFLDNFNWESKDMEAVMLSARESSPEEAAAEWIKNNQDLVNSWVEGLSPVDGNPLKMAYVAWDSEIASSNVAAQVLEKRLGYKVELTQLDNGPMWASLAKGDTDGIVSAWLPITHQAQYDRFKDQVEDLGPNLTGVKLGIVVPTYMEGLSSIKDLQSK
ncbi:MAG: glycine betaine ABC transporter substrate-binding protein [Clostridia bacterium]|nr:glycine betaine ABC transporter substrate-binding protein [Peptococcus niger]MDU7245454.1 glycine betaine ABC transporter substrate-binding protein [Clostridiales bacterium]MDU7504539.1 glycine betaine ABC transporter substrate-binding protein [Clostridia bacterium]